ncbi:MAG: matrixin family metalloprotease [Acidimicrobiales bacterium]
MTYVPGVGAAAPWPALLIGWSDLTTGSRAGNDGAKDYTVGGSGGSRPITDGPGHRRWVTGAVTISASTPRREQKLVLMHELGHVMGLGHVDEPTQIMAPHRQSVTADPRWGAGDLAGLEALGRKAGCLPDLRG